MKKYILLYALCFACPQLQAMEISSSVIASIVLIAKITNSLPDLKKVDSSVQFGLAAAASVGGILSGVITDFALGQDRQLTLHDYLTADMRWGVKLALLLGSDPYRRVYYPNDQATTAIHAVIAHNSDEFLVLFLAKEGDIDIQNYEGQTPLHVIAKRSHQQASTRIRQLVAHGACLQATDIDGNSPLHIAVQNEAISSVDELLKLKADPNAKDFYGYTPLHDSATNGNSAIINLLLQYGARTDIKTYSQLSVWDIALQNDQREAAELFLAKEQKRRLIEQHVSPDGSNLVEKLFYREIDK